MRTDITREPFFDMNSPLSLKEQLEQKRAARKADPNYRPHDYSSLTRDFQASKHFVPLSKDEVRELQLHAAPRPVRQHDALPFSASFKNARLPYQITDPKNYEEAVSRLEQIFGDQLSIQTRLNAKKQPQIAINSDQFLPVAPIYGNLKLDFQEAVQAYTNEIVQNVKTQVSGQKLTATQIDSPAFSTYNSIKSQQLKELVNEINENVLSANSELIQDDANPLHIAFKGQNDSDPIEVINFSNYDIAISALKTFEADMNQLTAMDSEGKESLPEHVLTRLRDSYTPKMLTLIDSNFTNVSLAV
jgi:hypothetical protein